MSVDITITVPDSYVAKVLEALNGLADKEITIQSKDEMLGVWSYSYEPKGDTEDNRVFAKRVFTATLLAFVRMYHHSEDRKRFQEDISNVTPITHDLPDEAVG